MAQGKIITFYSYKGGTGRSMALANTAWILALNGKKVLTIDWDLEAPGLHRYFLPFLEDAELSDTPGLIDLFWNYIDLVLTPYESWPSGIETPFAFANAQRYAVPLNFSFTNGLIHFLGAGQQDQAYATRVSNLDWNNFYARLGGMDFINHLQASLREQYDYILVDSRTGVADTAGICTIQIPDSVVLCYTLNRQSIKGIESVAKSIKDHMGVKIKIFPVAMRVERATKGYEKASRMAKNTFGPILQTQFTKADLVHYLDMSEVSYYPDYAFEETLATFKDLPNQRNTLLSDMVWLAETLTENTSSPLIVPEIEDSIREHYLRLFRFTSSIESHPINEAKLILVGRGNVGKTSLVKRLVNNNFDPAETITSGIEITQWRFGLEDLDEALLHIWDFGGQEIMHATHRFFFSQRGIYLLVINGREGGEDTEVEYWLNYVETYGNQSPVIIVMNKINSFPFDVAQRALRQKYPFIRGFIKTDCLDSTGIDSLRQMIKRESIQLGALANLIPSSWLVIKGELTDIDRNYIGFSTYEEICKSYGLIEPQDQKSLASYLHDLGTILFFEGIGPDRYLFNPRWVINGVYKILNSKHLENQKGIINISDLTSVLDARLYPSRACQLIFSLMKSFDLCFNLPDDTSRYLIPELLDKDEPLEASEFYPRGCLNFQYHYSILPEGLLPRFIVRTHALSEGQPRWRKGVILRFEDNYALVTVDVQKKTVVILISGPKNGRRSLLAIIRSDFERIHWEFPQLKVQKMVPLPDSPEVAIPYEKLQVMEQNGIKSFHEVVDNNLIAVNVLELLNGIDITERFAANENIDKITKPLTVFYSYSHTDESLRHQFETHLRLLQRQGLISTWHNRQIEAGEEWKQKIDDNLERADIILLLVSADFIASDYCYALEMQRALERHEKGEARVIPVIIRDVNMSGSPFAKLQALPKDALPVTLWSNKDSAWRNVAEGIEKAAKAVRQKRGFA